MMFNAIKEFLFGKSTKTPEAPYKVETPAPVAEPVRVETPAPAVTVDGHSDVHEVAKPAAKAPAKKQQFEKKPAKPRAPAKPKSPAKPRTPKTPATK